MIEFITTPEEAKELTFDMVEMNQFFIDENGYFCQKRTTDSYSVIANSDGTPYSMHFHSNSCGNIRRILPKVYKIRW